MIGMRKCKICEKSYPETSEHWRFDNGKIYRKTCIHCYRVRNNKCQIKYRKENKDKIKQANAKYYQNNKEKLNQYHSNYYQNNKEHINKVKAEYRKKRRESDPSFRLRRNVSRMISKALVTGKGASCLEYLEYDMAQLKSHLEGLFQEGMSWDNYGEWHIDHIIPQSHLKYDSMKDENFKKCWALENLQPLWKIDNLKKGNRI